MYGTGNKALLFSEQSELSKLYKSLVFRSFMLKLLFDMIFRYILWTEQNHPSGGKDSHLVELLERCVSEFKDEEKYKNDVRYVDIWLKFVSPAFISSG